MEAAEVTGHAMLRQGRARRRVCIERGTRCECGRDHLGAACIDLDADADARLEQRAW